MMTHDVDPFRNLQPPAGMSHVTRLPWRQTIPFWTAAPRQKTSVVNLSAWYTPVYIPATFQYILTMLATAWQTEDILHRPALVLIDPLLPMQVTGYISASVCATVCSQPGCNFWEAEERRTEIL